MERLFENVFMVRQLQLKWVIYLLIGVCSIAGFACHEEQEDSLQGATYIYKNVLESSVSLELYDKETAAVNKYEIEPNDSIIFLVRGTPVAFPFSDNESLGTVGDSVVLRISNLLCSCYVRVQTTGTFGGDGVFDLSAYENYSEELVTKESYTLRYEIGTKDLALGEKCENNLRKNI